LRLYYKRTTLIVQGYCGYTRKERKLGDRVGRLVSRYIGELEGKAEKRASKPVTFSMRLSAREHAKLVWLADNLGVPKTPFAEELLKAALDEAMERYAGWASPDDPEGFLADNLEGIEDREREAKGRGKRPRGPGRHPPKP
jgi:hypothetical protein